MTNTSTANEKTANETVETTAEIVFDEMYPDREDIRELGDDVRVGQRRVFKGQISWKTEKDFVSAKTVCAYSPKRHTLTSNRRLNATNAQ
jgi:putative aminopeptidase FrvX